VEHSLKLDERIITREVQHDLEELGIAKNAREEKQRARAAKMSEAKLSAAENERMAKLYRQHILKEEAGPETQIVQIKVGNVKAKQEATPAGFGD
jgi:hypothetical protein